MLLHLVAVLSNRTTTTLLNILSTEDAAQRVLKPSSSSSSLPICWTVTHTHTHSLLVTDSIWHSWLSLSDGVVQVFLWLNTAHSVVADRSSSTNTARLVPATNLHHQALLSLYRGSMIWLPTWLSVFLLHCSCTANTNRQINRAPPFDSLLLLLLHQSRTLFWCVSFVCTMSEWVNWLIERLLLQWRHWAPGCCGRSLAFLAFFSARQTGACQLRLKWKAKQTPFDTLWVHRCKWITRIFPCLRCG